MMREKYESLSLTALKDVAKARGLKGISTMKKGEIVDLMLLQDEKDAAQKERAGKAEKEDVKAETAKAERSTFTFSDSEIFETQKKGFEVSLGCKRNKALIKVEMRLTKFIFILS